MSNSFPKVSPDGRWIVFVQARNGQLMRPDSQLYIVPAAGGVAREMRCNTPLMNSWHSFSPNGRWLVFSSKSRSPYTQMFLTHLDEDGNDSPAILIENATAANRAVNIPEFVNIPPGGLLKIDAPVTEYYRVVDTASELLKKNQYAAAAVEFAKALELDPDEAQTHNNLGFSLVETGKLAEGMEHYRKALELSPGLSGSAQQSRQRPACGAAACRKPSNSSRKRWNPIRTTPVRTSIWARPWRSWGVSTKPCRISTRRSSCCPKTPKRTPIWDSPSP